MKQVFIFMLFAGAIFFAACAGDHDHHNGDHQESGTVDKSGPEYTSAYICPMHCEGSGSDQAGQCPECGMDYVANADHKMHKAQPEGTGVQEGTGVPEGGADTHEGHDHSGHDHSGHDHDH